MSIEAIKANVRRVIKEALNQQNIFEQVTGGKTAQSWVEFDQLGMLQQIGAIPRAG